MKASIFPSLVELHELVLGYDVPSDGGPFVKRFTHAPETSGNWNGLVAAALTPLATAFWLSHETAGGQPPAVDECTLNSWCTQHVGISTLRFLRVFARRKLGSAGVIAAQTINIYKTSAGGTLLGTISVAGAAAGANPVSDVFEKRWEAIGVTPILTAVNPLYFSCTAADADLEVCVLAIGEGAIA